MILKSLRYSHLTQVSLIQFFCCCLVIGAFRSEVDRRNEQVLGFTDLHILFSHVMEELCISQFQLRPSPPPGNCGAFAGLVTPGGGALANLARPGGRAFAYPGATPGLLTRTWFRLAIQTWRILSGKTCSLLQIGSSVKDWTNLWSFISFISFGQYHCKQLKDGEADLQKRKITH